MSLIYTNLKGVCTLFILTVGVIVIVIVIVNVIKKLGFW